MENKLRFPLDLQLFGEKGKTSGDIVDPDEVLNTMAPKNVDDETDDDLDEDNDYIDDDDIDEDDDSDDNEYIDDDEEDSDEDSEEDKESKDDESKKDEDDKSKSEEDKSKEDDKSKDIDKAKPQSRDVNKEQKALRLQREAEEKARKENFKKGFIAATGGVNPFTGEKIETDDDIYEATVMAEAKKRGYDPIQDYSKVEKLLKSEERERIAKEEQKKVDDETARRNDFAEFKKAYPDVNVDDLFNNNPEFAEFAEDLVGELPLTKIYAKFLKIQSKKESAVEDSKDMEKARRQSSPGSVSSGGSSNGEFYTLEELKKMSPSEVAKNWKKVERSYEHINKSGKK